MSKKGLIGFLLTLTVSILGGDPSAAQHHNNLWLRGTLSASLTERLRLDLEGQYRRQNLFVGSNDVRGLPLMTSFRPWLAYRLNKHWEMSISPLAYFAQYAVVNAPADEHKPIREEWRISNAQAYQRMPNNKWGYQLRLGEEWRSFDGNTSLLRLRSRFGLRFSLDRRLTLSLYDEILVDVLGIAPTHVFDQNRTGCELRWRWSTSFYTDLGYMHVGRLPATTNSVEADDNLLLHCTLSLPALKHSKKAG